MSNGYAHSFTFFCALFRHPGGFWIHQAVKPCQRRGDLGGASVFSIQRRV